LEGEPFSLLQDTAKIGIEGQSFIQKDGYYYMFYSAGACCGAGCDYHVKAVRSKSIRGPYEDVGETVLLGNNEDWKCMGHGTFVQDKKGDYYYLFHGYNQQRNIYSGREGLLAKLVWSDKGAPVFEFIPGTENKDYNGFDLDFTKLKKQNLFAQWDFRNSKPNISLNKQGLTLSGTVQNDNQIGTVLTWRPENKAYSLKGKINLESSSKNALKGIAICGDKNQAIGLGVQADKIKVWKIQGNDLKTLKEVELPKGLSNLELKIQTKPDLSCEAFYKDKTGKWQLIKLDLNNSYTLKDLAPWDRSPRPGIQVKAEDKESAVFLEFGLEY